VVYRKTVTVYSRRVLTPILKDCTRFWNTPIRNTVAVTVTRIRIVPALTFTCYSTAILLASVLKRSIAGLFSGLHRNFETLPPETRRICYEFRHSRSKLGFDVYNVATIRRGCRSMERAAHKLHSHVVRVGQLSEDVLEKLHS